METDRPLYAPGCFGSTLFGDDDVCRGCPYAAQCEPVHRRVVRQLREFHGFSTKEPTRQVGDLPVKVKKVFDDLGVSAEDVRKMMKAGVNPYSVQAGFVGIVCHILLLTRETTRATLKAVLMKWERKNVRPYNEATADVYARHAVQILEYCGVVEIEGDKIKLTFG